jgi:cyclic pyranopterin phosphate synthase
MDVGNRNGWEAAAVVPAAEMLHRIGERWPLEPLGRAPQGTAQRWRYGDGQGYLAVVASISAPFCGDCNRLRITADGQAYTCLFASQGTDLRPWLRPVPNPSGLSLALGRRWSQRQDRYSEERQMADPNLGRAAAEMAYLGG